ncbi:MAG: leucine-rich repeat domain-containing protein, partial [Bacteroidota bacterium]
MKKSFDIEKWNSLSDQWKEIYAINIIANFRLSKIQREKIFSIGQNPLNCYKSYFTKDFTNNITPEEIVKLPEIYCLYLSNLNVDEIPLSIYFENISSIDISYNKFTDLRFLENLSSVNELYCECNLISDINAISNLTNITKLNIRENKITSINTIRNFKKLTYLDIGRNQITDISPLSELHQLEEIQADLNKIEYC